MGWTYGAYPKNLEAYFTDLLTWSNEHSRNNCLEVAVKPSTNGNDGVLFAAVELTDKGTGRRSVWAAIVLLDFNGPSDHPFGHKDMDEAMGPYEYNCPAHILDMLTPTDHPWANKWRRECRENLKKAA